MLMGGATPASEAHQMLDRSSKPVAQAGEGPARDPFELP
jgi:hypothetical protein